MYDVRSRRQMTRYCDVSNMHSQFETSQTGLVVRKSYNTDSNGSKYTHIKCTT